MSSSKVNDNYFVTYLTEREEKLFFSTVKRHFSDIYAKRDYYWCKVARITAVRLCVLRGLTLGDALQAMDSDHLVIRPEINKRQKGLSIFCSKKLKVALRELIRIHNQLVADVDDETDPHDRPLIISRNTAGMSGRNFQDRMKKWCREAGLPFEATPHWWRHTWAKRQLVNSTSDKVLLLIQTHLQHDSIKTTQIYMKPDKEEMRKFLQEAK